MLFGCNWVPINTCFHRPMHVEYGLGAALPGGVRSCNGCRLGCVTERNLCTIVACWSTCCLALEAPGSIETGATQSIEAGQECQSCTVLYDG
jgi:hypothetical protein